MVPISRNPFLTLKFWLIVFAPLIIGVFGATLILGFAFQFQPNSSPQSNFYFNSATSSYTFKGNSAWNTVMHTTITVPESYNGANGNHPVTKIAAGAFRNFTHVTTIFLPDTITAIGNEAFRSCSALTRIILPDGLTSLGAGAFYDCVALEFIRIPSYISEISEYTFRNCAMLDTIFILYSHGMPQIHQNAFANATNPNLRIAVPLSVRHAPINLQNHMNLTNHPNRNNLSTIVTSDTTCVRQLSPPQPCNHPSPNCPFCRGRPT